MQKPGSGEKRIDIPYFEGVNGLVSFVVSKKTELYHAENARSKTIGSIEKREGQTVLGTNTSNKPFVTGANYALFPFRNTNNQGLYRISEAENSTISVNVSDTIFGSDFIELEGGTSIIDYSLVVADSIQVDEQVNENPGGLSTIYALNAANQWSPLTGSGASIPSGIYDSTYAEGNAFLVNFNSNNRYIKPDGITVVDSTSGSGHLYNTPPASRINFYKNRLYLADFVRQGVRYKTTVLRSSYPMGIISLVNSDYTALASGSTIDVTDTKFFYSDSGANSYDIYRGGTKITTITVTTINETSIVATWSGTPNLLASDEIWIAGTYNGEKIFRWVNNPSISGKDVKQYDTFKLAGGENDEITMLTNIGNVMLISNRSNLSSWNDYVLENFDFDIGCVSKRGYVKSKGILFFLHYTGIYTTSGGVPRIVSNKVERYINGATKSGKENSAAGKKGQSVFFTLGDVTLYKPDGSLEKVLEDVCLEFNLVQENWFVHTNVKSDQFTTFLEEADSDRLEFTDNAGDHAVKEFLSGETDDGTEIHMRFDTMKFTPQSDFENSINPIALLTDVERGSNMEVFVNLENEEEYYAVEGNVVKGLSVIKITNKDDQRGKPPVCRLISVSLRDSSPQRCKINRMSLIYLPTTDETPQNEG